MPQKGAAILINLRESSEAIFPASEPSNICEFVKRHGIVQAVLSALTLCSSLTRGPQAPSEALH